MNLANPLWLWGMSALVIPLAIHLLSRKEGKIIGVGSLRYFKDASSQQFKSLHLNEITLLLLRCLLFILVALFISGLVVTKKNNLKWVLLEEELKNNSKALSVSDSLINQGYELHELTSKLAVEGKIAESVSYWALAENLRTIGISDVIIISSSRAENFKGQRIEKPVSIQWITLPIPNYNYLVAATKTKEDSIIVKNGITENENTHFETSTVGISPNQTTYKSNNDSIHITPTHDIKIVLASDLAFSYDRQILVAALKAIQSSVDEHITITETDTTLEQSDSPDVLIWLSEKKLPTTTATTVIYYESNPSLALLYRESTSTWKLSKHVNEDVVLHENFSVQLLKIIFPNKAQLKFAHEKDQRTFPEKMMWSENSSEKSSAPQQAGAGFESLNNYLILFILVTWIVERLVAHKRNQ